MQVAEIRPGVKTPRVDAGEAVIDSIEHLYFVAELFVEGKPALKGELFPAKVAPAIFG